MPPRPSIPLPIPRLLAHHRPPSTPLLPSRSATSNVKPASTRRKRPPFPPPPASPTTSTSSPLADSNPNKAPPESLSSTSSTSTATAKAQLAQEWAPLTPRLRRSLPFLTSLILGLGLGTYLTTYFLSAPPEPGSSADVAEMARLQRAADELFMVKIFRGKCVAAGRAIRGEGAEWREVETGRGVGGNGQGEEQRVGRVRAAELRFEKEKRANREVVREREREIVASGGVGEEGVNLGNEGGEEERLEGLMQQAGALGLELDLEGEGEGGGDERFGRARSMVGEALGGSRGVAVERVFWNAKEAELVAVVYLGKALCGWPNTVHGGLLATVLGEKLGMAAELLRTEVLPSSRQREGGKGQVQDQRDWRELSELEVQYKKPTYAGNFYVVRALPRVGEDGDGIEVEGVLETLEGKVCVQVNGRVPAEEAVPSTAQSVSSWLSWLRWK
ncbi:hypothetical protein C1H76_9292 [Elsinoe australis]|uniref:Thioesterase domain-containing protein n=1 Tax=Elsinoe australis TaxID=40998 RepID=A0A4U7AKK8_9PEZI|nr:hypothetical protein C1H76_9292 [Elsinoe australis]